ncbi:DUF2934 domain-containing protein [Rhizobium sp. Root1220]|uniref:DUF2934 domain-containing protein n=1 Tax=Rhizobium sp. Root1220 TaxID=1736432 RepID=UPI0009E67AF8
MNDEDARRLRAYLIWESEGRREGEDLAHWYRAGGDKLSGDATGLRYMEYVSGGAPAGSLVIKFYQSGEQIRGFVRKIADPGEDDTIFPGEEIAPEAAFKRAKSHGGDNGKPVFIELVGGVEWDPSWGDLGNYNGETSPAETDDARSPDGPAASRRRNHLAREAKKGMDRAVAEIENDETTETVTAPTREGKRGKR